MRSPIASNALRSLLPLALAALAPGPARGLPGVPQDGQWKASVLDPLPGDSITLACAVNARGQVAGTSRGTGPGSPVRAVVWEHDGTPSARPPTPGGLYSSAFAINDRGEAAGVIGTSLATFEAAVWDRGGTPRLLQDRGFNTQAASINEHGEVAGTRFSDELGGIRGIKWERSGNAMTLPPLPGDFCSLAVAINNRGEVVGRSEGPALEQTAVLWNRHGIPRVLPPLLGDTNSYARDVNERGQATGASIGPAGQTAVVWNRDGTPIPLPHLPGALDAYGIAINAAGEVAGTSDFGGFAVVWSRNGHATALPLLNGVTGLAVANAIGPRSDVAGQIGTTAVIWRRTGAAPTPSCIQRLLTGWRRP